MLDVARRRPQGGRVEWIEADARRLRLREKFERIVLSGHSFQVFLSAADRAAVLKAIAFHLAPGGRFVFDSRNPAAEAWRQWTPAASLRIMNHPQLGAVRTWHDARHEASGGIVAYETTFEIASSGRRHMASARIAFPSKDTLARQISAAGLSVDRWHGDWSGKPFTPDSPEIIAAGRLAGSLKARGPRTLASRADDSAGTGGRR